MPFFEIAVTEKYQKKVIVKADNVEDAYEEIGGVEINMSMNDYVSDSTEHSDAVEVPSEDVRKIKSWEPRYVRA
jgi:hypothetical protein